VTALAEALATNKTLTTLDISDTKIYNSSAIKSLKEYLERNKNIIIRNNHKSSLKQIILGSLDKDVVAKAAYIPPKNNNNNNRIVKNDSKLKNSMKIPQRLADNKVRYDYNLNELTKKGLIINQV